MKDIKGINKITFNINNIINNVKDKYNDNPYGNPLIAEIAYPMDENTLKKMRFANLDKILDKPMEKVVAIKYGNTIAQGLVINEKNFPDIYSLLKEICDIFQIDVPYAVIDSKIGMEVTAVGTDMQYFLIIKNMITELLSIDQLRFLLAHECSHIAMKHMLYHTAAELGIYAGQYIPVVGNVLAELGNYPIKTWARSSEITADRIGLLFCQDLKDCQSAILKTIAGLTNIEEIDIDDYITNAENILSKLSWGKYMECELDQPLAFKRLKALEYFYNSETYYSILNLEPPKDRKLLTIDEVNEKVKKLLTI